MIEKNIELLKKFEGCELKAYKCSGGEITIGWGNTYYQNYQKIQPNDTITQEEADKLLLFHIGEFEKGLKIALKEIPLPQNCKDAITILVYNIGITAFLKSTLYKEIQKDKNNLEAIKKQWLRWCYADGKKLKGLENRRKAEFELYEKGILSQYTQKEKEQIFHKCNLK
jgi:lysozyme